MDFSILVSHNANLFFLAFERYLVKSIMQNPQKFIKRINKYRQQVSVITFRWEKKINKYENWYRAALAEVNGVMNGMIEWSLRMKMHKSIIQMRWLLSPLCQRALDPVRSKRATSHSPSYGDEGPFFLSVQGNLWGISLSTATSWRAQHLDEIKQLKNDSKGSLTNYR
jgi:hypothetical protein